MLDSNVIYKYYYKTTIENNVLYKQVHAIPIQNV